jgi:Putative transposase/Transposase zinc-binding domain
MSRPQLEVADIFRAAGAEFLQTHRGFISAEQLRTGSDIAACRTAARGGHVDACNACGQQQISYNSCRNRHCPKCQARARANWLEARAADLLPVPYFHLVFTLPETLNLLALQNPRVVYDILFRAASQTLLEVAANPKHLGAKIGCLAVLHTWGQNLMHHPHLHLVVPAGGLSPDEERWIGGRPNFFLPVRVLSRVFRGKFLALLRRAFQAGKLAFHGQLVPRAEPAAFEHLLNTAARQEWVVYAKEPFGSPEVVLKYLARYTHRVAISNARLLSFHEGQVTFRWKDYASGQAQKTMTVSAGEFLRRFLLHVLPRGFVRIRHYGLLANRHRQQKLALCRKLLGSLSCDRPPAGNDRPAAPSSQSGDLSPSTERHAAICPVCKSGRLIRIDTIERMPRPPLYGCRARKSSTPAVPICDTS